MRKESLITKLLVGLLIMVPVVIHLYTLNIFSLNYPFQDDHRVYLDFCYNFINSSSLQDKLTLLFTPDNESRPLLIRLSVLGELLILHKINFKHILYLVNGYTLILVLVFWKKYKDQSWIQIAFSFGLLSLSNWEMYFRNDVASYQLATVALSILAFFLLTSKEKLSVYSNGIFYLCFFLLPFGSGVGFIAAFLIVVYSLLKKSPKEWIILGLILLFQVFLYKFYASEGGQNKGFFDNLFKYKLEIVWAFFIALGGQFQLLSTSIGYFLSGVLGIITLSTASYYIIKTWKSNDFDFEKLVFVFTAGSLAIIVLKRYNYWIVGYESVLVSRYKFYGTIIFLLALSFLYREIKTWWFRIGLNAFIIILYTLWILKAWYLLIIKNEIQMMDAINMENDITKPVWTSFVAPEKYRFLTKKGYFDNKDLFSEVTNMLAQGRVVYPETAKINLVNFDPGFGSDWGGKKTILSKIELTGYFPASNTFFIELTDKNDKKILLNGFRRPLSVVSRLLNPPSKIDYLSKEIELDFYTLQKPFTCRVICVD